MRSRAAFLTVIIALTLSACSSRQLYGAGQAWKQKECERLPDMQERNRCVADNKTSYEDYRRQTEAQRPAQ